MCDGPATIEPARVLAEARGDRGLLGEGVFPLAELLAAASEGTEIALEIPAERLRLRGLNALQRAEAALRSFRAMFG